MTQIGAGAFVNTSLKQLPLPDGLTSIGEQVFAGCDFTEVRLPESLTALGDAAFAETALTAIHIPGGVRALGASAFNNCDALERATLDAGVTAIGASWKKSAGVTGYQVQYSVKKTFSGAKTVPIKKANAVKTTLTKLKAATTYYVRIRGYRTVKGVRYYSAWSAPKSKKTK